MLLQKRITHSPAKLIDLHPHAPFVAIGAGFADIERMIGGNAADFYELDTDKLLPLAERIGPERRWFRDDA